MGKSGYLIFLNIGSDQDHSQNLMGSNLDQAPSNFFHEDPISSICIILLTNKHCGLAGSTLVLELRGRGFKPRYRQIHSGPDDHLKWQSSVIGSYPQWQAKEPQGC